VFATFFGVVVGVGVEGLGACAAALDNSKVAKTAEETCDRRIFFSRLKYVS